MLNEAHYGAVLNYFYFLLMDEAAALGAAFKTVQIIQKKIKKEPHLKIDEALISTMSSVLKKYKATSHIDGGQPPRSEWKLVDREKLSLWKQHARGLEVTYLETLVLFYILRFSSGLIARGLGVPEGTVFYRLGKGLDAFTLDLK